MFVASAVYKFSKLIVDGPSRAMQRLNLAPVEVEWC